MEIITTDNPTRAAGEAVSQLIADHTGDTLCLLSGGSALEVIEQIKQPGHHSPEGKAKTWLSGLERPESLAMSDSLQGKQEKYECRTIFMMGDERGSRDPQLNNYLQLQQQYPDHWVTKNCIPTVPEENESLENFAQRISNQLDSSLVELSNLQIIYLMGISTDGHTAGIFPLPKESFATVYERDQSIVPVYLETLTIDSRASITPTWIQSNVTHVIGYAAGAGKKTTLESLKKESKVIHERPAELWKLKSGSKVYTDQTLD